MLKTDKEARRRMVCPRFSYCQGSDCMAWRWAEEVVSRWERQREYVDEGCTPPSPPRGPGVPATYVWEKAPWDNLLNGDAWGYIEPEEEYRERVSQRRGYCGLAGAPEHGD